MTVSPLDDFHDDSIGSETEEAEFSNEFTRKVIMERVESAARQKEAKMLASQLSSPSCDEVVYSSTATTTTSVGTKQQPTLDQPVLLRGTPVTQDRQRQPGAIAVQPGRRIGAVDELARPRQNSIDDGTIPQDEPSDESSEDPLLEAELVEETSPSSEPSTPQGPEYVFVAQEAINEHNQETSMFIPKT